MEKPMETLGADARFLKRILMILIAATIAAGAVGGIATVKTELANRVAIVASASAHGD
jgi:hypothetical protein